MMKKFFRKISKWVENILYMELCIRIRFRLIFIIVGVTVTYLAFKYLY